MGVLSRIGAAVRSFVMQFSTRSTEGWGYLTRRRAREELIVGDTSTSSIVAAAVGWIGRNFPEAPVRVQVEDDEGELSVARDPGSVAFRELLRAPNGWYSGLLLLMATVWDYWLDGNAYWLKVRDRSTGGRVVGLWWVPSFTLDPKPNEDDPTVFVDHYLYRPGGTLEVKIPPSEVVHFRWGFDPSNVRKGRSPLKSVFRSILTDEEASAYVSTILRNLGVPGVIISPGADDVDLEEADADAIKRQFVAQFSGDRRGEPMVIGATARVERISFSPAELNLRDVHRIPEERVTAVIGVPAIVAGLGAGLDRSTFANYAEAREAGYEENIIPTQRLFGADLEIQLLPEFVADPTRHRVDFDLSEVRVLAEDENKRWERAGAALARGAITLADHNRIVGLPVDEELHDVYLRDARIVAVRRDSPEATGEVPDQEPEEPGEVQGVPPEPDTAPVEPAANAGGNGSRPPAPAGVRQ